MRIFILSGSLLMLMTGLLHFYWAFGGEKFKEYVIPVKDDGEKLFNPSWQGTFAVGLALCSVASSAAAPAFSGRPLPAPFFWLCIMFAVIFFFRFVGDTGYVGFFRRHRGTLFARYDSLIYTPLSLFFSLTCAFSALYR